MVRKFCDRRPKVAFLEKIALKISGLDHAERTGGGWGGRGGGVPQGKGRHIPSATCCPNLPPNDRSLDSSRGLRRHCTAPEESTWDVMGVGVGRGALGERRGGGLEPKSTKNGPNQYFLS